MKMNRICGECCHYREGNLENPCDKGNKYCGYLIEGKTCWEAREGEADTDSLTKVCSRCGKILPLKMFYKTRLTNDKLTAECKICNPHHWHKMKAKRNLKNNNL